MRLLAMGAAGVGAMYFGYHFVTFIGRGGLAMLGNPLGTVMVPVLLHYVAALGLMIYVLYHLSRARTQAAYR